MLLCYLTLAAMRQITANQMYSLFQIVIWIPRPTVEWMHVCTKNYLFCFKNHLMRLQFSCNYAIFCWMFLGGTCRTDRIKIFIYGFNMLLWSIIAVELTNFSATQNHVVFQLASEQAKYGVSGILKRNQLCSFPLRLIISGFFVE